MCFLVYYWSGIYLSTYCCNCSKKESPSKHKNKSTKHHKHIFANLPNSARQSQVGSSHANATSEPVLVHIASSSSGVSILDIPASTAASSTSASSAIATGAKLTVTADVHSTAVSPTASSLSTSAAACNQVLLNPTSICLDPQTRIFESDDESASEKPSLAGMGEAASSRSDEGGQSVSPLIDVMDLFPTHIPTGTEASGTEATENDEWFVDYSKNDYKHEERKGKKSGIDIRKQIRYFAKNTLAPKYQSKCKKHDKGHKNN